MNSRKKSLEELQELQELVRSGGKKFVNLDESAALYSIGLHNFCKLAGDVNAIYRVNRRILVNTEIFDEFMEVFHECND